MNYMDMFYILRNCGEHFFCETVMKTFRKQQTDEAFSFLGKLNVSMFCGTVMGTFYINWALRTVYMKLIESNF